MAFGVEIRGTEQLFAKLDTLARVADEAAEEVAVAGALPIVTGTKENAPVKTGTLKRSYHIGGHVGKTPDTRVHGDVTSYGEISRPIKTPGRCTVFVGTNLKYARPVEFGGGGRISASARSALAKYGGGASGGNYRAARPHLRPAFDNPVIRARSRAAANTVLKLAVGRAWRGGRT